MKLQILHPEEKEIHSDGYEVSKRDSERDILDYYIGGVGYMPEERREGEKGEKLEKMEGEETAEVDPIHPTEARGGRKRSLLDTCK